MRIIEAGVVSTAVTVGRELYGNVTCCPTSKFPHFTVECLPDQLSAYSIASASFIVNGHIARYEFANPFTISGLFTPWDSFPRGPFFIECELSNGEKTSAWVDFQCPVAADVDILSVAPSSVPQMTPVPSSEDVLDIETLTSPELFHDVELFYSPEVLDGIQAGTDFDVWPLDVYIKI